MGKEWITLWMGEEGGRGKEECWGCSTIWFLQGGGAQPQTVAHSDRCHGDLLRGRDTRHRDGALILLATAPSPMDPSVVPGGIPGFG